MCPPCKEVRFGPASLLSGREWLQELPDRASELPVKPPSLSSSRDQVAVFRLCCSDHSRWQLRALQVAADCLDLLLPMLPHLPLSAPPVARSSAVCSRDRLSSLQHLVRLN